MTFALKFHDTELFHSCSPLYICDWKTVKTESVSDDVLGTLRPREGVTWCCADRRTRRQLKARSRYFGNSSDRNSWGAGTRCRQTITASHRLLNYSGLPVVSSQEVKKTRPFLCGLLYDACSVPDHVALNGKIWNEAVMTKRSSGRTDENRDSWWPDKDSNQVYATYRLIVFSYPVVRHFLCTSCIRGRFRPICSVSFNSNSQGLISQVN